MRAGDGGADRSRLNDGPAGAGERLRAVETARERPTPDSTKESRAGVNRRSPLNLSNSVAGAGRTGITFRAVNRKGLENYDPGLQRHHLLPLQLVAAGGFRVLFESLGRARIGFDDFRRNGLLLPAREERAQLLRLPLHRGPHRHYNAMVMERVGAIEARWTVARRRDADAALDEALFRLSLLQSALRRRLLSPEGRTVVLNRRDPGRAVEARFDDLDAMAELLWMETAEAG